MRLLRILVAVPILCLAAFLLSVSAASLAKLFADYKDSNDSTYIIVGALGIMTASMLVVWSFLAAFGQMRSWRALAACVLLLAAAALPYAQATGSPVGYVVNVSFVILAVIAALFALQGWRLRTE